MPGDHLLLTRAEIVSEIKRRISFFETAIRERTGILRDERDVPCDPVTLPNVRGQRFYVLRVDEQDEEHYIRELGYHPIARMPEAEWKGAEWKCVDFLVNVEIEG